MGLGAFVSLFVTVLTASLTEPIKTRFVEATLICGIATLAFFLLALREWWNARQFISTLEKEVVEVTVIQEPETISEL